MRQVRGAGRFGVITALAPDVAARVAIKNGWINRRDGRWHIACLAVTDEWALTVLTQYPVSLGFGYGYTISITTSSTLKKTATSTPVVVAVTVPSKDGSLPVVVEQTPRSVGPVKGGVAQGLANRVVTLRTG